MRKRISKQKDIKPGVEDAPAKSMANRDRASPLATIRLLLDKTECLQQSLKFEKERIDKIIKGTSIESIKFQEIQKNCSFEQFLKKYYPFEHIKYLFTDLINSNALTEDITFMDFKLKNFIIMNNYSYQLRRINNCKNKEDQNLTASRSSTKETKHFKEMEIEVKKITKKQAAGSRRKGNNHNGSASFTNLLIKNIQRMLKNYRQPSNSTAQEIEFKPILTNKAFQGNETSQFQQERLHTSPQPFGFDAYGLEQFKQKHLRKFQQISQMSHIQKLLPRSKLNTEKSQDTLRYQTQYDTEKINTRRSKSKKNLLPFKKSVSKGKSTSKGKTSLIRMLSKGKK